jgi:hypothetical protein
VQVFAPRRPNQIVFSFGRLKAKLWLHLQSRIRRLLRADRFAPSRGDR